MNNDFVGETLTHFFDIFFGVELIGEREEKIGQWEDFSESTVDHHHVIGAALIPMTENEDHVSFIIGRQLSLIHI